MGPQQDGRAASRSQTVSSPVPGRPRTRRCLLKGCEKAFRPIVPQDRYCSDDCREKAREWSSWRADRKYRATESGKQRRRAQSTRYREKARQRSQGRRPMPGESDEGDPPGRFPGNPCDRPGCYVRFPLASRSPLQRFCSCPCRKAWRRVIQRERRWGMVLGSGSDGSPRSWATAPDDGLDPPSR